MAYATLLAARFDGTPESIHISDGTKLAFNGKLASLIEGGKWETSDVVINAAFVPGGTCANLGVANSSGKTLLRVGFYPTKDVEETRESPFHEPRLVTILVEYVKKVFNLKLGSPIGFFKEFAKPKAYRILAAEIKLHRAEKHFEWCEKQKEMYDEYRRTYTMYANGGNSATHTARFMDDEDYEYARWEGEAWREASSDLEEARSQKYKAERNLQHVKEMHESQVTWAANDRKRRRANEARWAKKRKNRDDRHAAKKRDREHAEERGALLPTEYSMLLKDRDAMNEIVRQFDSGEKDIEKGGCDEDYDYCKARANACSTELATIKKRKTHLYQVIAGEHENLVGKHAGVDVDDSNNHLVKITEGYKNGTILSIPRNDLDWKDDVDADEKAELEAFDERCNKVKCAFRATVHDLDEMLDQQPKSEWVYTYNNLKDRFRETEWRWYFDNADAEWADKPSKENMITMVKDYCDKQMWTFEFRGYGSH